MKIIDGTNAILGRLSSYAAKETLKGEKIVIVNCEKVIITGSRKDIEKEFLEKRSRVGSGQRGPKHSKDSSKIVKRTIKGMLPNAREGRGREALKRVKCYNKLPEEYEDSKMVLAGKDKKNKFSEVKEFAK